MISFAVFLVSAAAGYGLGLKYAHDVSGTAIVLIVLTSVFIYGAVAWGLNAGKYRELKALEHEALDELSTCILAFEKQFGIRPTLEQSTEDKLQEHAHIGHQVGHLLTNTTAGALAGAGVGVAVHATTALVKHAVRYFTTTAEQRAAEDAIQALAEAAESARSDATSLRVTVGLGCVLVAAAVFAGAIS